MKKILFVVATVAMVSCGSNKEAAQQTEQEVAVVLPKIEVQQASLREVSQEKPRHAK